MNIFKLFNKHQTAPAARERLQLLLAHERSSSGSDLVALLREEIIAVIARHVELDHDKVQVKIERSEFMSTLEIDVELPLDASLRAA